MTGLYTLIVLATLSFILSLYTLFLRYGPLLESFLSPVLSIRAVGASARTAQSESPPPVRIDRVTTDGNLTGRICFRLDMMKYKPCRVSEFHWDWLFNSTVEPAEVVNAGTNTPFRPQTTIISGPSLSQVICSDLPKVSYSYRKVTLRGTVVYEHCGIFSQLHQVTIPIRIDGSIQHNIPEVKTEEME